MTCKWIFEKILSGSTYNYLITMQFSFLQNGTLTVRQTFFIFWLNEIKTRISHILGKPIFKTYKFPVFINHCILPNNQPQNSSISIWICFVWVTGQPGKVYMNHATILICQPFYSKSTQFWHCINIIEPEQTLKIFWLITFSNKLLV